MEINLGKIKILTPNEFLSQEIAPHSLVLCDDADFIDSNFIEDLKHISNDHSLILVTQNDYAKKINLTKRFSETQASINFIKTNPYPKAMQLLDSLLNANEAKDILLVSNQVNREKLYEDLNNFIKDKVVLLDSSKSLIDQNFENLRLATYTDIIDIHTKYIILIDIDTIEWVKVKKAVELCEREAYILYEESSSNLIKLKEKYEGD